MDGPFIVVVVCMQAILVSTSDYVKNELLLIQRDLRPLEERAATVESEIREAMGEGTKMC